MTKNSLSTPNTGELSESGNSPKANLKADDLSTAVWVYDFDGFKIHSANTAALALWESHSLEELTSRDFEPDTSSAVRDGLVSYRKRLSEGESINTLWRIYPKGHGKDVFSIFSPYYIDGNRLAMLVEATPVEVLREHSQIGTGLSLATFNKSGDFISGNPAFIDDMADTAQHISKLFVDPHSAERLLTELPASGRFEDDVLLQTDAGQRWFHALAEMLREQGASAKILLQLYDIHQRKIRELVLNDEACRDPLTGLLSRRGLVKKFSLDATMQRDMVVFYMDLDGFKLINDTYGHAAGDELLVSVAKRLTAPDMSSGTSCRIGGDEFIWTAFREQLPCNIEDLAKHLVESLADNYFFEDDISLSATASVGIACNPEAGNTIEELIISADTAMYLAKQAGRRRFLSYQPGMEKAPKRRSQLAQHLRKAAHRNEFSLSYQPIYDNQRGQVFAFEVLLNWCSDVLGQVATADTIRVAEETGMISEIENWVIKHSLSDLPQLKCISHAGVKIAVNISAQHINDNELPGFLDRCLNERQLHQKDILLELTESSLVKHAATPASAIQQLADLNYTICIDDFGTGYSSLSYLHLIPARYVKIDKSFVHRLSEGKTTLACISQLITSLNMQVVAEGVESEFQRKMLSGLGIHLQQGYFYGRPAGINKIKLPEDFSRPEG